MRFPVTATCSSGRQQARDEQSAQRLRVGGARGRCPAGQIAHAGTPDDRTRAAAASSVHRYRARPRPGGLRLRALARLTDSLLCGRGHSSSARGGRPWRSAAAPGRRLKRQAARAFTLHERRAAWYEKGATFRTSHETRRRGRRWRFRATYVWKCHPQRRGRPSNSSLRATSGGGKLSGSSVAAWPSWRRPSRLPRRSVRRRQTRASTRSRDRAAVPVIASARPKEPLLRAGQTKKLCRERFEGGRCRWPTSYAAPGRRNAMQERPCPAERAAGRGPPEGGRESTHALLDLSSRGKSPTRRRRTCTRASDHA